MKTLKVGDRVKILTGRLFKGTEATIDIVGIIDGKKKYSIITDGGLIGWFCNKDLEKL